MNAKRKRGRFNCGAWRWIRVAGTLVGQTVTGARRICYIQERGAVVGSLRGVVYMLIFPGTNHRVLREYAFVVYFHLVTDREL